ncbi:hypothetical protein [Clostridium sp. ZBS18]|uniref:hypothetical protein n=1 Tax=Clostridium sp. ZBS18 TaxID=2949967 RepID=UPI00207A6935|nr:hypothetical protein [Clostridium sp. ZBS18]
MLNMERVYLFQNWEFGSESLDDFKKWDIRGEKYKILKQQDIYVHTDSQCGFLIMSLNKEKLLEVAEKRKQEKIKEYESKIEYIKGIEFN